MVRWEYLRLIGTGTREVIVVADAKSQALGRSLQNALASDTKVEIDDSVDDMMAHRTGLIYGSDTKVEIDDSVDGRIEIGNRSRSQLLDVLGYLGWEMIGFQDLVCCFKRPLPEE